MKHLLLSALLLPGLFARGQQHTGQGGGTATPAALIKQQVAAYNARNLDRFLSFYADSVQVFIFPSKLVVKGKEAMKRQYAALFQKAPNLHCTIKSRIVRGNTVIDKERVTGIDGRIIEAVAVYQIEAGKIRKVYFID